MLKKLVETAKRLLGKKEVTKQEDYKIEPDIGIQKVRANKLIGLLPEAEQKQKAISKVREISSAVRSKVKAKSPRTVIKGKPHRSKAPTNKCG